MKILNKYLLLCGLSISSLCAKAADFDSIACTGTSSHGTRIGISWIVNWSLSKQMPGYKALITVSDGKVVSEINATSVVMERIAGTQKFRVTRMLKGTSTNHQLKPLTVRANDDKHKYLSITYLEPTATHNVETWVLNGYVNKNLYQKLPLRCEVKQANIVDVAEMGEGKSDDSTKVKQFPLVKLSADIMAWFNKNQGFTSKHKDFFKLVWIAPDEQFFSDKNSDYFAFEGRSYTTKYTDEKVTRQKVEYQRMSVTGENINYYVDGSFAPELYYYGSYMRDKDDADIRARNGVLSKLSDDSGMGIMSPVQSGSSSSGGAPASTTGTTTSSTTTTTSSSTTSPATTTPVEQPNNNQNDSSLVRGVPPSGDVQ